MKFLIIGGFLGSGKTSLLLQLISYMREQLGIEKTVILENEIGRVGIDDRVLSGAGYSVQGLFAGCVCCTMAGELTLTVQAIERDLDPEWIIMEATGMAFPQNVKENLADVLGIDARICCLVDAKRWPRLLKPMAHLLPLQLKEADVVLINKIDLIDGEALDSVRGSVTNFCEPEAEIFPVSVNSGIEVSVLDRILGRDV
ncbi:MAG: cobalamin biosynthesis protein P47K [Lachnospiraceae bacterium]|nr:cobalamin biosynthesis protein P47K [Lachnospiraceae bacterium]